MPEGAAEVAKARQLDVRAWLSARREVVLLVALLLLTLVFPDRPPLGIYLVGFVSGAGFALPAVAVVLIYRANRIINFAQVAIGMAAASLMATLLTRGEILGAGARAGYFPLAGLLNSACDPCVRDVTTDTGATYPLLSGVPFAVHYVLAVVLTLVFAVVLSLVCYLVVQRFSSAPRLIVTVATIFFALAVSGARGRLPFLLVRESQRRDPDIVGLSTVPPPWGWRVTVAEVDFTTGQLLSVVLTVAALGLLAAYLRRSRTGLAVRAGAENPSRVATLGVNGAAVTRRIWMVTGLLAGLSGMILAMQLAGGGTGPGSSPLSASLLVKILAAALIARFTSVPLVVMAAVTLGVLEQAARFSFGSTAVLDGSLLVIIAGTLLLQRGGGSRAAIEQASSWKADREIRPIPRELRGLPAVRTWLRAGTTIGVVFALGLPWVLSSAQATLATVSLTYAMVGLSLLVLTGWAGQISLGQGALAAVGGYAAAVSGLPFPAALFVGTVAGAVVAFAIGLPALRLAGLNLAIVSLAFAVSTTSFLLNPQYLGAYLPTRLPRPSVLGVDFADQRAMYYLILLFLLGVIGAVLGMRRSPTARMLIASRDNAQAAQSFGVNLMRARLSAFVVSGAIAGLAGGLFAYSQEGVNATSFVPELSVNLFLVTVIGGFGSVAGPLLGAAYFGVFTVIQVPDDFVLLTGGLGGLALLLTIGGGLSQLVFRIRDNLLRRIASRYGVVVASLVADVRLAGERPRIPIGPKVRAGGGTVFVPRRYKVGGQWAFGDRVPARVLASGELEDESP